MLMKEEAITKVLWLYIPLNVFVSHTKTNKCHITPPRTHPHCLCTFLWPRCWPQARLNESVYRTSHSFGLVWAALSHWSWSLPMELMWIWDLGGDTWSMINWNTFFRAKVMHILFLYLLCHPLYLAPAVCYHPGLRSAFSICVWETVFSEN